MDDIFFKWAFLWIYCLSDQTSSVRIIKLSIYNYDPTLILYVKIKIVKPEH